MIEMPIFLVLVIKYLDESLSVHFPALVSPFPFLQDIAMYDCGFAQNFGMSIGLLFYFSLILVLVFLITFLYWFS